MGWLQFIYLRFQNRYFDGPGAGMDVKGIWRYKTEYGWAPMGGQGGNNFKVRVPKRTIRKFRLHALKKMAGLFPCSEEEREKLWEIWKNR
jgi:hypothetical protein